MSFRALVFTGKLRGSAALLVLTVVIGALAMLVLSLEPTSAGHSTTQVKDIFPGGGNSFPVNLAVVGSTLFFAANDGSNGVELWKSDGTAAGTVLVKDILPGGNNSAPANLTDVGGTLFFHARDGSNGVELWKSDGTTAGTVLVKDIFPGSIGSIPAFLTDVGGTLFFRANDGTTGNELWESDGTTAGTVLVKDIRPGSSGSVPANLTDVGGTLFFGANDGSNGFELWKSVPPPPPTPTPTATPCPDFDSDTLCDADDPDDDNDGCTDAAELQATVGSETSGGLRNPLYYWDFMDMWVNKQKDRRVNIIDIGAIVNRIFTAGDPGGNPLVPPQNLTSYHLSADRSPPIGPNLWNAGPPDGDINIIEIGLAVVQFSHDCN